MSGHDDSPAEISVVTRWLRDLYRRWIAEPPEPEERYNPDSTAPLTDRMHAYLTADSTQPLPKDAP